ncbi:MAG: XrtA/PEP-CTERM system histidine kinase PrsK [Pontixanthobacter sp.]
MSGWAEFWLLTSFVLHLLGGVCAILAAIWIVARGDHDRTDRLTLAAALGMTAAWCVSVAALGSASSIAALCEIMRNLAWIYTLYRMFANDGRDQTMTAIRLVAGALIFVELLQIALLYVSVEWADVVRLEKSVFELTAMFRIMVAVGVLVLIHNLYVGAAHNVRSALRWTAMAVAAMWVVELNYFTTAYLGEEWPLEIAALRGLVVAGISLPLAVGSGRSQIAIRLRPSRIVAFQSLSLLAIGAYLAGMVAFAQSLLMLGGDFSRLTQVGFTAAAMAVALIWLPSKRLRGWVRVTALKHLFQHRYDYRAEWLRFTQTIGQGDAAEDTGPDTLQERVVQALADITDSPRGILLRPDDRGMMELVARWRWDQIEVPPDPIPRKVLRLFEDKAFILELDDLPMAENRDDREQSGQTVPLPQWLRNNADAWAAIPLLHFDRLMGVVILAKPAISRRLDWEDFDLLRVVGKQLASYLAENAGQQALMEAARFDEFNRRIAFVMHDIKNLASQMSLLAHNAEKHAEKPEFRADMLVTLTSSADKLNGLLARLNNYGPANPATGEIVDLERHVTRLCTEFAKNYRVTLIESEPCAIEGDPQALHQALSHLLQNAVEAAPGGASAFVKVTTFMDDALVEIVDTGVGMSAEFLRDGLFKPFASSKNSGFGIGAFEAREIVKGMGGRIDVRSREGEGSRFVISLPLANAKLDSADESELQIKTGARAA